jgi:hypothetical protein
MTAAVPGSDRQAEVEAALLLLDRMGLSPADLMATARARRPVPTFAEYVPENTRGRGLARGNVR